MIYACIGSRETPQSILDEMVKVGTFCRENGIWVRSGHADGADWAFEQGAQELCVAYIPKSWPTFNKHLISRAHKRLVDTERSDLRALVERYHPAPEKLSRSAWGLMARDGCQVLGEKLDSPSDLVICWTKDGKDSGGTGQALRIAKANGIPIINMYWPMYSTAEKVIKKLQEKK